MAGGFLGLQKKQAVIDSVSGRMRCDRTANTSTVTTPPIARAQTDCIHHARMIITRTPEDCEVSIRIVSRPSINSRLAEEIRVELKPLIKGIRADSIRISAICGSP